MCCIFCCALNCVLPLLCYALHGRCLRSTVHWFGVVSSLLFTGMCGHGATSFALCATASTLCITTPALHAITTSSVSHCLRSSHYLVCTLAADMQRFARPERLMNGPTVTHFWCILKLLDVLVQLDHLKNAKASIPNDFSWYKSMQSSDIIVVLQPIFLTEFQQQELSSQNLVDLSKKLIVTTCCCFSVFEEHHDEASHDNALLLLRIVLIVFCVESLELDFTLLYPERHTLLRILPVLVVLASSSDKESESMYKRIKINRLLNIFKNDPVIPAFPDLHLSPAAIMKELSMLPYNSSFHQCSTLQKDFQINEMLTQNRGLRTPFVGPLVGLICAQKLVLIEFVELLDSMGFRYGFDEMRPLGTIHWHTCCLDWNTYQRRYLIVNHIGTIRAEHDDFSIRFASALNQIVVLQSIGTTDSDWSREVKGNMYDLVVEGFQLLSRWTGRVWEQCAWKFSRPCKEPASINISEYFHLKISLLDDPKYSHSDEKVVSQMEVWELLPLVVRWNYTSDERKALLELVGFIKSVGLMMERCDTLVADALWETIHAEVQDFVQDRLDTMLRTTFRKKKDLSRILSDMRTLAADWMANTSRGDPELRSLPQENEEIKQVAFYPRPVAPTTAQLVSGGNLRKPGGLFGNSGSGVSVEDLKQLETFFYKLGFFLHIIDYKAVKDLGDLMLGQLVQNCGDDVSGCRLDSGYVPIQDQGKGRACMRGGFDVANAKSLKQNQLMFPIECSLPWMLVEHVIESQDAGLFQSILMPFDIYNDSAQHALAVLKQRFLYDEIEAEGLLVRGQSNVIKRHSSTSLGGPGKGEWSPSSSLAGKLGLVQHQSSEVVELLCTVNYIEVDMMQARVDLCFDQLVYKLHEIIFSYYKSFAASALLDQSFVTVCDDADKYSTKPMRFNEILNLRRIKALGRTINLRSLITQRMNRLFRENIDFLFDRFESQDLCAVVELQKLLDVLKLTHQLLSEVLELDSFTMMLNEMQESLSLVSFSSRLSSQIWAEMQNDFLPNYILCNTTQRFIRSSTGAQQDSEKATIPAEKPYLYCGSQDLNLAYQSLVALYSEFFGIPHMFAIVQLLGPRSLPWILRAVLDHISSKITAIAPRLAGLQEALPKSISLLSFDGGVVGNFNPQVAAEAFSKLRNESSTKV
ncbi:hypothetical protein ZIOFF_075218 [Zingiber officinale]|uniref:Uncharacterized protein n=1 Tax=Zingiber officinale TaxID=94328 RepID=A0A8J5ESQ9_ZINOF|nr:hypothetical protein ZIOFF_075218 [Zingiber officinale]